MLVSYSRKDSLILCIWHPRERVTQGYGIATNNPNFISVRLFILSPWNWTLFRLFSHPPSVLGPWKDYLGSLVVCSENLENPPIWKSAKHWIDALQPSLSSPDQQTFPSPLSWFFWIMSFARVHSFFYKKHIESWKFENYTFFLETNW